MASHINYLLRVKVTHQQTVFTDLIEFSPIKGLSDSDFGHVYGDSFVAGYTDGGEFSALISIKLREPREEQAVRESLAVYLSFQAAPGTASRAAFEKLSSGDIGELTIAVSSVGGQMVDDERFKEWTLEAVKSAAIEFPRRAVAWPLRIEYS